jgi:hypothetical protein
MTGFTGMPVVSRPTAQDAGHEDHSAYDAVIVSS